MSELTDDYQGLADLNYRLWQIAEESGLFVAALTYKKEYEKYMKLVKLNE